MFQSASFASPRAIAPPWPEQSMAVYGFDGDELRLPMSPVAAGEDLAVVVESWSGHALTRDALAVSPVVIPVVSGRTNVAPLFGAIRFWFRPNWSSVGIGGKGPGDFAHLLELVKVGNNSAEVRWSLYMSEEGDAIYLSGKSSGGFADLLKASVAFEAGQWRMITFCYGPNGTALFVDGEQIAEGEGLLPPSAGDVTSLGLVVGSDVNGGSMAGGQFEQLTTFDYWQDAAQQQFYFNGASGQVALGPISAEEEEALQQALEESGDGGGGMMMMALSGPTVDCLTNGPVYLTNTVCLLDTNGWTVAFDIQGGTNDVPYDIFSSTNLSTDHFTNWVWQWLDVGYTCNTYQFTNQPEEMAFYILTVPGADTDGDGLYDGWEWKHFGTMAQGPGGDYDADGETNGDEYTNNNDPNSITFALSFGSGYTSGNSATGSVVQLAGVPAGMAILVNDTNFAAASWQAYDPDVVVDLGSTDGVNEVWVGLRGRPYTSAQEWRGTIITRDTVPPVVVVSEPSATVVRPMIQLQGRVSETLSTLTYDLTNSSGLITNQPGYITGAQPDTNTWTFTTNYFQCYDVPLAEGANQIKIRAADLAGNVTVTNFTFTLNSSGNTNAPAITVLWPPTNMPVAGTNFTLQGMLDDDTATVIISGLGANAYSGIVERGGRFSVANLPLPNATNVLTIAATNANGIGSTLQRTVLKSVLAVEMDALTAEQLSQTFVTVTGNVSDDSKDVWVNGVQATVESGGAWQADNVPVIHSSGQGKFDIKVYPAESDPELTAPLAALTPVVAMPPVVSAIGYVNDFYGWDSGACGEYPYWTKDQWTWRAGTGGQRTYEDWDEPDGQTEFYQETLSGDYAPITQWNYQLVRFAISKTFIEPGCPAGWYVDRTKVTHDEKTLLALTAGGPAQAGAEKLIRLTMTVLSDGLPVPAELIQLFGRAVSATTTNADVIETYVTSRAGASQGIPITVTGVQSYSITNANPEDVKFKIYKGTNDVT